MRSKHSRRRQVLCQVLAACAYGIHGWLCAMVPLWAAGYGGKILYLLDHPEMRELIAAAPQAGRLLRPLLWMTGRYTPAFLALPKRVRAPRETAEAGKQPTRPRRRSPSAAAATTPAAPVPVAPGGDAPGPAAPSAAPPPSPPGPTPARWRTARRPGSSLIIFWS